MDFISGRFAGFFFYQQLRVIPYYSNVIGLYFGTSAFITTQPIR